MSSKIDKKQATATSDDSFFDVEKGGASSDTKSTDVWHVLDTESTMERLDTSRNGLSSSEADTRLESMDPTS